MAELYLRARLLVERGYRQPLTLAGVARAVAVSPRQLERAYDEIGLTTFLAHQPLTVTDVARLVGYRQPSPFIKAFRARYRTTPGAYRDRSRARREASGAVHHHGEVPSA
jgi:transcriptional regulator GlxA family with amidase domain